MWTRYNSAYSMTPLLRQSIFSITFRYTNSISIDNTDPIVVGVVRRPRPPPRYTAYEHTHSHHHNPFQSRSSSSASSLSFLVMNAVNGLAYTEHGTTTRGRSGTH
ncbi:hypothetical protein CABS01_01908 [Colletotrichum abscissum]|uniref:Uncharacterized protein n=1 Tax=Colletotrichum abscissum TaxID=1671311 RepID=A0A9Q0B2A5_9PEZI|nr:uncharacterized protein CABS01_01908 [Colletotrichum abscissum]KAI3542544.1 hypothetical protein CABS02_10385 [Colletotrichum abscissum]KAK1496101.1 hypothetical protein CABS01_01908 [Colletotrichum abscissum]